MKRIESKVMVPDFSPSLRRDRLFAFLDDHLHKPLILVTCEGGYGKTTLVSHYIRERSLAAVWYQLGPSDRNPSIFLSYLKSAIGKQIRTLASAPLTEQENVQQEVDQLSQALSGHSERLVIVLDDFHHVNENEDIKQILLHLLQSAASAMTLILISRVKPDLPLARFKVRQQLAELKSNDLAFTPQEIDDFFRSLYDLNLPLDEIQLIRRKTEGWAASLVLMLDVMKEMDAQKRKHFLLTFLLTEDIYSYLATEVLAQQSEELQRFLYDTCLFDEMDPAILNAYLGMEQSSKILEHLLSHHLFIYKDYKGSYKYHHLFRVFLYQRLRDELEEGERYDRHVALARLFEENHQLFRAFSHYIWGKNYVEAARLMRVMVKLFKPESFLMVVDGSLEFLTPDDSLATTSLFLFRCVPLSVLAELIPILEKNLTFLHETTDVLTLSYLKHCLATIYFYRGALDRSLSLYYESLQGSVQSCDYAVAALNYSMLSQIYRFREEYATSIDYSRQLLSNGEFYPIPPHVKMHAYWNLAEAYLVLGDLDHAEALLQETIQISDRCDEASKSYPYSSMCKLFRLRGEFDQALIWGKRAVEHAHRFQIDADLGWSYLELGTLYLETGQLDQAEEALSASRRYFAQYSFLKRMVDRKLHLLNEKKGEISVHAEQADTQILSFKLLGKLAISRGSTPIKITRKSSLRLLLFFLAHRGRRMTKDTIMDSLFPEASFESAHNQFYVSLSVLRKALEPELESGRKSRFIIQEGVHFFLSTNEIWVDTDEFLRLAIGEEADANSVPLERFAQAEALYRDDYLVEFEYEPFLEAEREKYRHHYLDMLERLARYYGQADQREESMKVYERILDKDPFREHVYVEYLDSLLHARYLSQARQLVAKAGRYLQEELGIPLEETFEPLFAKYPYFDQAFVRNHKSDVRIP